MKVKTSELDAVLQTVVKAAGNKSVFPLTCVVTMCEENGKLLLYTTNQVDTMYGTVECEQLEKDFVASVDAASFAKLVHSANVDTLTLTIKDNVLHIKGKGNYKLALILDGRNKAVKIVDTRKPAKTSLLTLDAELFKRTAKALALSSAAPDFVEPAYHDFYFGDVVLASNTEQASFINVSTLSDGQLLYHNTVDLLSVFSGDITIELQTNDYMSFTCAPYRLVSSTRKIEDVPDYQAAELIQLLQHQFTHTMAIEKSELLDTLNRFALFNQPTITLDFSDGLTVKSDDGSFEEKIVAACAIDCERTFDFVSLKKYISAIYSDTFELSVDEASSMIKLTDGDITHIIAANE